MIHNRKYIFKVLSFNNALILHFTLLFAVSLKIEHKNYFSFKLKVF